MLEFLALAWIAVASRGRRRGHVARSQRWGVRDMGAADMTTLWANYPVVRDGKRCSVSIADLTLDEAAFVALELAIAEIEMTLGPDGNARRPVEVSPHLWAFIKHFGAERLMRALVG